MYIHERENWTNFYYSTEKIAFFHSEVKFLQGKLIGYMENIGFSQQEKILLESVSLEIQKSCEIEGIIFETEKVRSSVARRFNIKAETKIQNNDKNIEGIVLVSADALKRYKENLTKERLCGYHAALFPTGWSGFEKIDIGEYRKNPMQIISGVFGREVVHYIAPSPERIEVEMKKFLDWFNCENEDSILKSAIAHYWFVAIHPFDDGNGRLSRILTEILLSRSDNTPFRFYSLSSIILQNRNEYDEVLEKTSNGNGDLTDWILFFLKCLKESLENSLEILRKVAIRSSFWEKNKNITFNERQKKVLVKLLDDFFGNLTSSKWAKMCKCSQDSAQRDINDLISKGILKKSETSGRNTNYELVTIC